MSTGVIAGISVACALLLIGLVVVGLYALRQRKARREAKTTNPFGNVPNL